MILKKRARVWLAAAAMSAVAIPGSTARSTSGSTVQSTARSAFAGAAIEATPGLTTGACDPSLLPIITPQRPTLGRYEICTVSQPIDEVVPAQWTLQAIESLDVFGTSGTYDRFAMAKLFGGTRARVARGWIDTPDRFESVTLVSPYPDATLTRLQPGTLIIRWMCGHMSPACAVPRG